MKKIKVVSRVFVVLFFGFAAWNFFICLKAITLGQGNYGGNIALYLMLLCFVGGMYIPRIVWWVSEKLNLIPLRDRK